MTAPPPVSTRTAWAASLLRVVPPPPVRAGRAHLVFERNLMVYRRIWPLIVSGFFEPLFYLLSVGIGIGELVGDVSVGGRMLDYTAFVAPALLASSAMNGAIYDATFNIFWKLRYGNVYDAMLATPLGVRDVAVGETMWALFRGLLYAAAFLVVMLVMGLAHTPWVVLALPAAMLVGFAFAAVGLAATTFMHSWQDFEFVQLAMLPMFLFSTTFYPLSVYPGAIGAFVRCTPLYHGIELIRPLTTGGVGAAILGHVTYLAVMGAAGLLVAGRRLERQLLK